jgi:hypothetical protein
MVKPTPPTAPEAPLRSDPAFSTKAQTFLTWLSGVFYTYVGNAVDYVDERADEALAAATTFGFPSITGKALNFTRVNSGATALEFRTAAQVRSDIGATTVGAAVFTAADAAAARSAIGGPPPPQSAAGVGQELSYTSGVSQALVAPAGGIWRVYWLRFDGTAFRSAHGAFVGAGGSTIAAAVTNDNYFAFAWRQS